MSDKNRPEERLISRLQALSPPDLDEARQRAMTAARVKTAGATRPRRLLPRPSIVMIGSILLTMLLATTLTTPGRAVAEWVGERFGIGEPGGAPTLSSLHDFADLGDREQKTDYIVLAAGEHEIGGRFEIVTNGRIVDGNHCLSLDSLGGQDHKLGKGISGGACQALGKRRAMTLEFLASRLALDPHRPSGNGIQALGGRVSPDVERVAVTLNGRELPVEMMAIDPEILAGAGIDQAFKVFLTFTDDFLRGGIAVAQGFDAEGELVVERRHRLLDHVAMHRAICEGVRERQRRNSEPNFERFIQVECGRADAIAAAAADPETG